MVFRKLHNFVKICFIVYFYKIIGVGTTLGDKLLLGRVLYKNIRTRKVISSF